MIGINPSSGSVEEHIASSKCALAEDHGSRGECVACRIARYSTVWIHMVVVVCCHIPQSNMRRRTAVADCLQGGLVACCTDSWLL